MRNLRRNKVNDPDATWVTDLRDLPARDFPPPEPRLSEAEAKEVIAGNARQIEDLERELGEKTEELGQAIGRAERAEEELGEIHEILNRIAVLVLPLLPGGRWPERLEDQPTKVYDGLAVSTRFDPLAARDHVAEEIAG